MQVLYMWSPYLQFFLGTLAWFEVVAVKILSVLDERKYQSKYIKKWIFK